VDTDAEEKFEKRDLDIMERLGNTRALTRYNFRDNAVVSELDVVVFVHTSDKTHKDWLK
jgi:hypothetical protein